MLTREQHLTQIDGLAAAAAHELGTPLSTITLIVREMEKSLDPASPIAADMRTLREQTQRCRDILAKLTQLSSADAPFDRMRISALVEEAVAPHRGFGIAIRSSDGAGKNEPVTRRNPAVLYGLGNILENAVDFARETVEVDAWWDSRNVEIVIADDGPGIAPDILRKIGEPYLSRRPADSGSGGLGLGIFIARTLLERSGAKVSFRNRIFPAHGAIVHVMWPREAFEIEEPGWKRRINDWKGIVKPAFGPLAARASAPYLVDPKQELQRATSSTGDRFACRSSAWPIAIS